MRNLRPVRVVPYVGLMFLRVLVPAQLVCPDKGALNGFVVVPCTLL